MRRPSCPIRDFARGWRKVRAATQVDYPAVASLKMPVLEAAFERFRTEHLARHTARAAACRAFLRERGEPMRLHTLFDAIDALSAATSRYRRRLAQLARGIPPSGQCRRANASPRRTPMPWISMATCSGWRPSSWPPCGNWRASCRLNVGLYGDYAVGVNASGSETWSDQSLYCTGAAIGAPPDPIGVGGQEWGIPPQDPRALSGPRTRPSWR